jgi:hypothetical protein
MADSRAIQEKSSRPLLFQSFFFFFFFSSFFFCFFLVCLSKSDDNCLPEPQISCNLKGYCIECVGTYYCYFILKPRREHSRISSTRYRLHLQSLDCISPNWTWGVYITSRPDGLAASRQLRPLHCGTVILSVNSLGTVKGDALNLAATAIFSL